MEQGGEISGIRNYRAGGSLELAFLTQENPSSPVRVRTVLGKKKTRIVKIITSVSCLI